MSDPSTPKQITDTLGAFLGRGVLAWTRSERQTDRYGSVFLDDGPADTHTSEADVSINHEAIESLEGAYGRLIAVVKTPRESTHVGDFFHGYVQQAVPEAGAEVTLGEGHLFIETGDRGTDCKKPDPVGVEPADSTERTFWMDPEALYHVHDSTVELRFEKIEG